jgi:putative PIN family toxin of toxin-antitoxin system
MKRVVVDTNLLLRMAAGGRSLPLYRLWRERRFALVTSPQLIAEFERVMAHAKVRRFLSPLRGQEFLRLLCARAVITVPASAYPQCRDPRDDIVVATAVAARPCFLVTADRDLYDDADLVEALSKLGVSVARAGEFLSTFTASG